MPEGLPIHVGASWPLRNEGELESWAIGGSLVIVDAALEMCLPDSGSLGCLAIVAEATTKPCGFELVLLGPGGGDGVFGAEPGEQVNVSGRFVIAGAMVTAASG